MLDSILLVLSLYPKLCLGILSETKKKTYEPFTPNNYE